MSLVEPARLLNHPFRQSKRARKARSLAERVGFEPTLPQRSKPDFESGAFDHSATSP